MKQVVKNTNTQKTAAGAKICDDYCKDPTTLSHEHVKLTPRRPHGFTTNETFLENIGFLKAAYQYLHRFKCGPELSTLNDWLMVTDAPGVELSEKQMQRLADIIYQTAGAGSIGKYNEHVKEAAGKNGSVPGPDGNYSIGSIRRLGPFLIRRRDSGKSEYRAFKIALEVARLKMEREEHVYFPDTDSQLEADRKIAGKTLRSEELAAIEWKRIRRLPLLPTRNLQLDFHSEQSILQNLGTIKRELERLHYTLEPAELPSSARLGADSLQNQIFYVRHPEWKAKRQKNAKKPIKPKSPDPKTRTDILLCLLEARQLVREYHRDYLATLAKGVAEPVVSPAHLLIAPIPITETERPLPEAITPEPTKPAVPALVLPVSASNRSIKQDASDLQLVPRKGSTAESLLTNPLSAEETRFAPETGAAINPLPQITSAEDRNKFDIPVETPMKSLAPIPLPPITTVKPWKPAPSITGSQIPKCDPGLLTVQTQNPAIKPTLTNLHGGPAAVPVNRHSIEAGNPVSSTGAKITETIINPAEPLRARSSIRPIEKRMPSVNGPLSVDLRTESNRPGLIHGQASAVDNKKALLKSTTAQIAPKPWDRPKFPTCEVPMALILTAEQSGHDLFRNARKASEILYTLGWPVADQKTPSNVLALDRGGMIYYMRADEALFALQLALLRGHMMRVPRNSILIAQLIGSEAKYHSEFSSGNPLFLDPFSAPLFELEKYFIAERIQGRGFTWCRIMEKIGLEHPNNGAIGQAIEFAKIMAQRWSTKRDIAVLNVGLLFRTNQVGFWEFEALIRNGLIKPGLGLNTFSPAQYTSDLPPVAIAYHKPNIEPIAKTTSLAPLEIPPVVEARQGRAQAGPQYSVLGNVTKPIVSKPSEQGPNTRANREANVRTHSNQETRTPVLSPGQSNSNFATSNRPIEAAEELTETLIPSSPASPEFVEDLESEEEKLAKRSERGFSHGR